MFLKSMNFVIENMKIKHKLAEVMFLNREVKIESGKPVENCGISYLTATNFHKKRGLSPFLFQQKHLSL